MPRTFDQLSALPNAHILLIAECTTHPDALQATRVAVARQYADLWFKSAKEAEAVRSCAGAKAFVDSLMASTEI